MRLRSILLPFLALIVITACLVPAPATQSGRFPQASVERVVDGDTIVVAIGGRRERVRYIGIDAPELGGDGRPSECYARAAAMRNEELVGGRTVGLEKDQSEVDRFGRLLRYVYVGDLMVNAELVREGFARAVRYPPDTRYADLFERLEREARAARRGLWGSC